MKARTGDWVRFYRDGKPIIGDVLYVLQKWNGEETYYTDRGAVDEDAVFEARGRMGILPPVADHPE